MSPSLLRIRWRLIWVSLLALSLTLGGFYLSQWVYAPSDDQCFWKLETRVVNVDGRDVVRPVVMIQEILPGGVAEEAGLMEGDELLEIDGRKIRPTREDLNNAQRYINDQKEDRVLFYTLRREGRIIGMPVGMVKPLDRTKVIMLITGFMAWAIGLLVVVSTPQRKIARQFFYLGSLTLMVPVGLRGAFGNLPSGLEIIIEGVRTLVRAVGPPLLIHFFLRFPHPFPLRTNRKFLAWLYGGFGLLGLTSLFSILLDRAGAQAAVSFTDQLNKLFAPRLFGYAVAGAFLVGLGLFWAGAFRLPRRKRQGLMPALIISTAILFDLLLYSWLTYRYAGESLLFQRERYVFFAPLLLLPVAFGYAIFRHGFFDVRRAILRWITYFVVVGATLVAYLGGLAWLFSQSIQAMPPGWAGALLGLSALPVGWLLKTVLLFLRRKFRRDLHTSRDLILGHLRETRKRFSEEALLTTLSDSLREAFRPQLLLMLPVTDRTIQLPPVREHALEDVLAPSLQRACKLTIPAALVRHARDNRELVLGLGSDEADWIREQDTSIRLHLDALEAQVLVLILVNEEPHTVVILGGKYAELNYGRDDREMLREVAMAASIVLETAVLHRRILDQGRLEQELQTARRIQENLVTLEAPTIPGYQVALRLDPALETGGDLLWVKQRSGRWIAAVGDVSGKGLPAALYMAQTMALLKFATQQDGFCLETILPALDQTLRNLMGAKDFLTLAMLELEPTTGRLRVIRAGHPAPLLLRSAQPCALEELAIRGRGLGMRPKGTQDWEVLEAKLEPGDWVVMYSDGITEAMGAKDETFGLDRLRNQLCHMWSTGSVRAACEAVYRDVTAFETRNRDDRTLFILGRQP